MKNKAADIKNIIKIKRGKENLRIDRAGGWDELVVAIEH